MEAKTTEVASRAEAVVKTGWKHDAKGRRLVAADELWRHWQLYILVMSAVEFFLFGL
jgi:hypothetical protein